MSATLPSAFRRLLIDLSRSKGDPATLGALADFAHLLGLHLHGLFIEDEALMGLAGLPFARELRLPTHDWRRMETGQIEAELRQAADIMHRRLDEVVRTLGVPKVFEVMRGDPAACIQGLSCPTDIIAVAEPAAADRLATASLARLCQGPTAPALLVLPPRPAPRHGPIAAVMADPSDQSLDIAASIAAKAHERLIVLESPATGPTQAVQQRVQALGITPERLTIRDVPSLRADDVIAALAGHRARLVVMTRGTAATPAADLDAAAWIAMARQASVLLAERHPPAGTAAAGAASR